MVKVKICGTTRREDADAAVACGADALGFIFYKKSPRNITQTDARKIISTLPPFVKTVGVFVNETADAVNRAVEFCKLDAVQLHGDESPSYCKKIRARSVIKAIRVRGLESLSGLDQYPVAAFLLDAFSESARGGTGKTFDWPLALKAKKAGPVILAGGLTPSNVYQAVRQVKPYAVDICSGVEATPGIKDNKKLEALFKALRT
ncbi:MAG: phosphoribosylanthranilate isomerase [Candidatus Nitrohelix vancouverensis]|uniref:N-(5'-phosphoribosyl)anthranilate isomerase n=1 Tax=Candidatus Nitrohelix vancouverensis TaxID=2705534 RepID=A0A7T0C364_9BACT|nr:MAG: phosphoribosylanthranilate isomerase [Candidatus Nitrohelix vancouverensis]